MARLSTIHEVERDHGRRLLFELISLAAEEEALLPRQEKEREQKSMKLGNLIFFLKGALREAAELEDLR